jgi:nicotinamide-nucleotide adenylyltransferase
MLENPREQERSFQAHIPLQYLEQFTQPVTSLFEEQQLMEQFREEYAPSDTYHSALVIGRFQPLHRGHIHLIKQALALSEHIVIGIGSANVINEDNPFSVGDRHLLLERAISREGLGEHITNIVHLNDYSDDTFWLRETLKKTGEVDAVFGNNEWVNGIFENAGYAAVPIPLLQRGIYEGKKVRAKLRQEGLL